MAYHEVAACRLSGSRDLRSVLHLGEQALTGVFPERVDEPITRGPLELVFCPDSGLLQLHHSYDLAEMYGLNYGYRSGLNRSMVDHLARKTHGLERTMAERGTPLQARDIVLDIGSNDATLLTSYQTPHLRRLGIDPTGVKFGECYPADIGLVPEFFSAGAYRSVYGTEPARLVLSRHQLRVRRPPAPARLPHALPTPGLTAVLPPTVDAEPLEREQARAVRAPPLTRV